MPASEDLYGKWEGLCRVPPHSTARAALDRVGAARHADRVVVPVCARLCCAVDARGHPSALRSCRAPAQRPVFAAGGVCAGMRGVRAWGVVAARALPARARDLRRWRALQGACSPGRWPSRWRMPCWYPAYFAVGPQAHAATRAGGGAVRSADRPAERVRRSPFQMLERAARG